LNIQEIQEYLPHRYPFLLVDRVVEVVAFEHIKAYKNISANEPQFNGHFPGLPIFPGVMVIEAMAQAAGILGFKSSGRNADDGSIYLFAGADKVRFRRQVVPGDRLELEARYLTHKRGIWKFECSAYVDGQLAASATLTCADKKL